MPCNHVSLPGGGSAIICGRGSRPILCATCRKPGPFLCDWKVGDGTCDEPICKAHTTKPVRGKDLCPTHARQWFAWQEERQKRGPKTCRCGRGKVSGYDGKCGHCRSSREQREHTRMRRGL